jgi:hypothetical protein
MKQNNEYKNTNKVFMFMYMFVHQCFMLWKVGREPREYMILRADVDKPTLYWRNVCK